MSEIAIPGCFAGFGHGENVIRTENKGMYLADYGT